MEKEIEEGGDNHAWQEVKKILSSRNLKVEDWGDLPNDLLFLLFERIVGVSTYMRCGAVCRSWHCLISTGECKYKPLPWLMLSETEGSVIRQFYDLSTNEIYEFPLPEAQGRKILGSNFGWLITVGEDAEFHLLNSLTRNQIALPPMSTFPSRKGLPLPENYPLHAVHDVFSRKATLSADPSTNDDVVVVLLNLGVYEDFTTMSFCRLSSERWENFTAKHQFAVSYVAGKFYSVCGPGLLSTSEVDPQPETVNISRLPSDLDYAPTFCYVVECDGELLLIQNPRFTWYVKGNEPCFLCKNLFQVHKLNMVDKTWAEITSIGDYALFLGNNQAICLPATSDIKAYTKNTVYLSSDDYNKWVSNRFDMGVFSLDDIDNMKLGNVTTLDRIRLEIDQLDNMDHRNKLCGQLHHFSMSNAAPYSLPIWFVPNLAEVDEARNTRKQKRQSTESTVR